MHQYYYTITQHASDSVIIINNKYTQKLKVI